MRLALNLQRVDPQRGGAETYVADLCRQLVRDGHQVDLYAESWREEALPPQVNCIAVAAPGKTKMARIMAFGRNSAALLSQAEHDCSVGFINTWGHDVLIPQGGVHRGSLDANAKRFPLVWQRALYKLGKLANPKYWQYQAIEKLQYDPDRGARVVAVGTMVREHLIAHHNVHPQRIHLIPNAIHADRLRVDQPGAVRCAYRNKVGLKPNDLVGLFVGHNFRLKGLQPLLLALAGRKSRGPSARPIHLLVCGGGNLGPFRRMTSRLGLNDVVRLIGYTNDIREVYWASDFFVSPTYYDPCSLVVFEALACGLPVITTACNGAGDLIVDGQEGFVVTAPDALGELGQALDHMADDGARRRTSAHALRLGREQSFENHVARLVKVFEEVAAKSRRGPHLMKGKREASPPRPQRTRKKDRGKTVEGDART